MLDLLAGCRWMEALYKRAVVLGETDEILDSEGFRDLGHIVADLVQLFLCRFSRGRRGNSRGLRCDQSEGR